VETVLLFTAKFKGSYTSWHHSVPRSISGLAQPSWQEGKTFLQALGSGTTGANGQADERPGVTLPTI